MDSLMLFSNLLLFSTLVEFYFWWSSTSDGAFFLVEFFFTQLRLCPVVEISFLLLLLLCSPVRCGGAMGIGIGQFTQQCSSVSKSLTCYAQGPGFDPQTTILVGKTGLLLLLLSSEKKKSWLCSDWL
mmetsp:Transcript_19826/g.44106  ORF Transcript_19826/g.44106 Transcript_19826/m.44106 type:complete len:127 (+) Transcript_19826:122-502(+)